MKRTVYGLSILFFFVFSLIPAFAAGPAPAEKDQAVPTISISEDMDDAIIEEATRVKEEFKQQARSLFERQPLGWNLDTIAYLTQWSVTLPQKLPEFSNKLVEHSRTLGVAGSLLVLVFLIAVIYSLLGRKRVLSFALQHTKALEDKLPKSIHPYYHSILQVFVSVLIPLGLLGVFSLIQAMIKYRAAWFLLAGKLLWLWVILALINAILREVLTGNLFESTREYGKTVFRITRLIALSIMIGLSVFWGAAAFMLRADVLSFLRFAISITIVFISFLLLLKKRALLSMLPALPYSSYRRFAGWLQKYYYPLIIFSVITALLWCIGYKHIGRIVLVKLWSTALAFVLIMLVYHLLRIWLRRWAGKTDTSDESAQYLIKALRSILTYATVVAILTIILNMLGLLNPLQRLMSFPVLQSGDSIISLWVIIKAVLIVLTFVFGSRLLQAYFDYKIYPALGIDTGLGYALNTFFKYFMIAIGIIVALNIVGIDLRFLLVFAGAIGIGIGLGLQSMAANVIAGFTIIFGGKIRKGDWLEVHNTIGQVTDIYLRATKVRTRDNIEYLVPNSDLVANIIVNYSLSSPEIRVELPVGVSYDADPRQVESILLDVAKKEPLLSKTMEPTVRFVEYGDNSINFELLIWMDVQRYARRRVKSVLYFAIFEEFKKAGIEIPFPQRDLHIRSTIEGASAHANLPFSADKQ